MIKLITKLRLENEFKDFLEKSHIIVIALKEVLKDIEDIESNVTIDVLDNVKQLSKQSFKILRFSSSSYELKGITEHFNLLVFLDLPVDADAKFGLGLTNTNYEVVEIGNENASPEIYLDFEDAFQAYKNKVINNENDKEYQLHRNEYRHIIEFNVQNLIKDIYDIKTMKKFVSELVNESNNPDYAEVIRSNRWYHKLIQVNNMYNEGYREIGLFKDYFTACDCRAMLMNIEKEEHEGETDYIPTEYDIVFCKIKAY